MYKNGYNNPTAAELDAEVMAEVEVRDEFAAEANAAPHTWEGASIFFDPTYYLRDVQAEDCSRNEDGTYTISYKNLDVTVEIKKVEERW